MSLLPVPLSSAQPALYLDSQLLDPADHGDRLVIVCHHHHHLVADGTSVARMVDRLLDGLARVAAGGGVAR